MKTLIAKLGATGDVVRTTPLLRRLVGEVTWITSEKNAPLLYGVSSNLRCFAWEEREQAKDTAYDLVINLEDTLDVSQFVGSLSHSKKFGAYSDNDGTMHYTRDSKGWFQLSLISEFGREAADRLKLQNRRSYQDLIFEGLGLVFGEETYILPKTTNRKLVGDVAIAAEAGPVWPMKRWAHYEKLRAELESRGIKVNILPQRATLLEHLCDIRNHRCLVGGDSLPMHLALGCGTRCVSIFTCTSPWEIHDYGIMTKIISPLLADYFYSRRNDPRATTAIGVPEVLDATLAQLRLPDARNVI